MHSWWKAGLVAGAIGVLAYGGPVSAAGEEKGKEASAQEGKSAKPLSLEERKRKIDERRQKRRRFKENRRKRRREKSDTKRKKMLESAERFRKRAAEMRQNASTGKLPPASARPGAVAPTKERMLAQAERLEKRAEALEARAKNPDSEKPTLLTGPELEKRKKEKRERARRARQQFLKSRWGATLKHPNAMTELEQHARRIARLKRLRMLAQKSKKDELARKATQLLAQEHRRHDGRMKQLEAEAKSSGPSPQKGAK